MNNRLTKLFGQLDIRQLIKFGLVGVFSNLSGYLLYLAITSLGVGPKSTVSILFPIGAILNYLGNRNWTFSSAKSDHFAILKHALVFVFGYFLNVLLLLIFVDYLHFPHQLVQIAAIFIVALYIYVAMKYFVFSK